MSQTVTIYTKTGSVQLELPAPEELVLNGIKWGAVDAFPTPAYWQCQVIARRLIGAPLRYKLGNTLTEEVAACLLGGHGIPATVGLAAYEKLRDLNAFNGPLPTEYQLSNWLHEPLNIGGRQIRYRFAAQRAKYLAAAIPMIQNAPEFKTGKALRDWLVHLPGIGPKTGSWIARNWLDADDVAILDIHIMRVGQAIGLFPKSLTVERHYFDLEALFLKFSQEIDVRASELDAIIWHEMASSPMVARVLYEYLSSTPPNPSQKKRKKEQPQAELAFA